MMHCFYGLHHHGCAAINQEFCWAKMGQCLHQSMVHPLAIPLALSLHVYVSRLYYNNLVQHSDERVWLTLLLQLTERPTPLNTISPFSEK